MDAGHRVRISHAPAPPIFKLHCDILGYIFNINADMNGDNKEIWETRALNVLRYTSQVCHDWRETILSSPSLWGKVIDVELPHQNKVLWRQEVLRRSCDAPLCISGSVNGYLERSLGFFSCLLMDHWPRIRKLDVSFTNYYVFQLDVICTAFQRPAPHLESFMIFVEHWDSSDSHQNHSFMDDYPKPLFSDHAPMLREFMFPPTRREIVRLGAPWFNQLHSLSLFQDFTAAEVLVALENIPSLKSLDLHERVKWSTLPEKKPISLPSLSNILVYSHLLSLLEHIIPSSNCSLTIWPVSMTDEDVVAIQRTLTHFSQFWFDSRVLKTFTIKYGFKVLSFGSFTQDGVPSFQVFIHTKNYISPSAVPVILGSFSPMVFHDTSSLEFILTSLPFHEPEKTALEAFLSSFSSVEVLHASEGTIKFLLQVPTDHQVLFPSLKTLKFRLIRGESKDTLMDILIRFAVSRAVAGAPITDLDIE